MTRTLSMWTALVAILVGTAGASAQGVGTDSPDPVVVAQRCVAQFEQVRDRTVDGVAAATRGATGRIARLDADGAPDRVIIAVGNTGVDRVQAIGRAGSARIARGSDHCTRLLRRLGADRALIVRVQGAADGFQEDIRNAVRRGTAAIRQAVADAIG
ncbi:MAG: hypothetical protein ACIAS6_02930 [Phycisphaerales bacterium JB060]